MGLTFSVGYLEPEGLLFESFGSLVLVGSGTKHNTFRVKDDTDSDHANQPVVLN